MPPYSALPPAPTPLSRYVYMTQLLDLDNCRPANPSQLPAVLANIESPVEDSVWRKTFLWHPDKQFTGFTPQRQTNGFRISDSTISKFSTAQQSMPSWKQYAHHRAPNYIGEEMRANRPFELSA